jgi:hypothetical protein
MKEVAMKTIRMIWVAMLVAGLYSGAAWSEEAAADSCSQEQLMERGIGIASENADAVNDYYLRQASEELGCCSEAAIRQGAVDLAVEHFDGVDEGYIQLARATRYCNIE